jgi:hypothetical protein
MDMQRWAWIAAAIATLVGCDATERILGTAPPGGSPALMTSFIATKEGGSYKIQYSLQDKDLNYTDSRGRIVITFEDFSNSDTILHLTNRSVKGDNFKKYKTLFGGEVWAHVIIISGVLVEGNGSDELARVRLRFTTSGGKVFEDTDSVFL